MNIFAVTGSRSFPFDRFIIAVDEAAFSLGLSKENVFAQIGTSKYTPKHISFESFIDKNIFDKKLNACDILITPCAAGTVLSSLKSRKRIVVVARLHKYGEHIDDHQLELASILSEQNLVLFAEDLALLPEKIMAAKNHVFDVYSCNPECAVEVIDSWILNNA